MTKAELTELIKTELSAIALHSGEVYAVDDQIDVVVIENYDAHYARAIERIVAILCCEAPPERHPLDYEAPPK